MPLMTGHSLQNNCSNQALFRNLAAAKPVLPRDPHPNAEAARPVTSRAWPLVFANEPPPAPPTKLIAASLKPIARAPVFLPCPTGSLPLVPSAATLGACCRYAAAVTAGPFVRLTRKRPAVSNRAGLRGAPTRAGPPLLASELLRCLRESIHSPLLFPLVSLVIKH